MSEKKNELVNEGESAAPRPKDGDEKGDMKKVDQGTQEKAAEEREGSGGYD